jgi:hypothetical protein
MEVTMRYAQVLAAAPVSSLIATKQVMMAPLIDAIVAARGRENAAFAELLGAPANIEAMTAFAEKREPDFSRV